MSLIRHLPKLLVGVTGVAAAGYLAWRRRPPPTHTRELSLDSLAACLDNWLPKLPYVSFIRIEAAPGSDMVWLSGDGATVLVSTPRTSHDQGSLEEPFRRTCAAHGVPMTSGPGPDGGPRLWCQVPADRSAVHPLIESLLCDLYGVDPHSRLTARVPLGDEPQK